MCVIKFNVIFHSSKKKKILLYMTLWVSKYVVTLEFTFFTFENDRKLCQLSSDDAMMWTFSRRKIQFYRENMMHAINEVRIKYINRRVVRKLV